MKDLHLKNLLKALALLGVALAVLPVRAGSVKLLNVSYDPTRELYQDYDAVFTKYWKAKTGQDLDISLSNGGSGAQARAVIDGLDADVVTLGLAYDIDAIAEKAQLLPKNWQTQLPNNSTPYTSAVVFLVRKGNPKHIQNWSDIVRSGVSVITPNPKTSGGGRWAFLAAWGYALKQNNNDSAKAHDFVKRLYQNVPVLDAGARGSTTTFLQRRIGDVLLAWENEALLAEKEFGIGQVEIVIPPITIFAEPPVAVVSHVASKHQTSEVAKAYLEYLYSDEGQEVIARNFYRPISKTVLEKHAGTFPPLNLFTVKDVFGGWQKAQKTYFNNGGVFDQIYKEGK